MNRNQKLICPNIFEAQVSLCGGGWNKLSEGSKPFLGAVS